MNNDEKLLLLLNSSRCLSKKQMLNYRNETLFPEELRAVELHLAECELCNFALDGYAHLKDPESLINSLKLPVLNTSKQADDKKEKEVEPTKLIKTKELKPKSITKKLEAEPKQNKIAFDSQRKSSGTIYKVAGIAAILLIGFGLVWYLEFNSTEQSKIDTAELTSKNNQQLENKNSVIASTEDQKTNSSNEAAPISATQNIVVNSMETTEAIKSDTNAGEQIQKTNSEILVASNIEKAEVQTDLYQTKPKEQILNKSSTNIAENANSKSETVVAKSATNKSVENAKAKTEQEPEKKMMQQSDYEIGFSLFKKQQYASAVLYLNSAASDKNDAHHWDAVYFSALCNKNMNNTRKAKKLLKQIVKANAPQKSAAEKQLEEIGGKDED